MDFTHYFVSFPNFGGLAQDLRFYRPLGVEGIYLQGTGHDGGGGEFSLLRPYYGMRRRWDPDQKPGKLLDEFLDRYCWDAAPSILSWHDLLQKKVDAEDFHLHPDTNPSQGDQPEEERKPGEALIDEAETLAADDPVLLDRVRVARTRKHSANSILTCMAPGPGRGRCSEDPSMNRILTTGLNRRTLFP